MPPPTPRHLWRGPVAQGASHSLTAMGSSSNHAPKLPGKRTFQCRAMAGRERLEQGRLTSAKRACNLHCVIIKVPAISCPCTLGSDPAFCSSALRCSGKSDGLKEPLITLCFAVQKSDLSWVHQGLGSWCCRNMDQKDSALLGQGNSPATIHPAPLKHKSNDGS